MLARLEQWVKSFEFHFYALVCYLCRSQSALGASCMGWCICGHCWFCQYAKWSMQHRVSIHAWMCCPCLVICSQGTCQLMTHLFLLMFCWWHVPEYYYQVVLFVTEHDLVSVNQTIVKAFNSLCCFCFPESLCMSLEESDADGSL